MIGAVEADAGIDRSVGASNGPVGVHEWKDDVDGHVGRLNPVENLPKEKVVDGGGRWTGQVARGWRGFSDRSGRSPLVNSLERWTGKLWSVIGADGGGRGIGDASGRSVHSGRSPVGAAEWKEIAWGRTQRGGAQGAGIEGGGDETRESPLGMPSSHGAAQRAGSLLRAWGEEGGGGGSGGSCD